LQALAVDSVGNTTDNWDSSMDEPMDTEFNDFVSNHDEFAESFPVDWKTAIGSNAFLQDFGGATAVSFAQWLLDQSHTSQYICTVLHFWSYLLAFILKLGINLPVRVGLGRRQNKWLQITNTNAGTLLGRSFGLQIQVLEWLVGVIFENHLDCAFDVVHIAKPEPAFFFASQQHFSSLVTWYRDHSPVPSDWHESAF
jgi:hypothetical protein